MTDIERLDMCMDAYEYIVEAFEDAYDCDFDEAINRAIEFLTEIRDSPKD